MIPEIDWSVFDEDPLDACTCRLCDTIFKSHSKFVLGPKPKLVARRPCPKCGSEELRRASSAWWDTIS